MKIFITAITVSIIVHLLIFSSYKSKQKEELEEPKPPKATSVKYVKLATKESVPQKEQPQTKEQPSNNKLITPPTPIPKQERIKDKKTIEIPKQQEVVKETKEEIKQPSVSSLESALKVPQKRQVDELTQSYIDLYGDEFITFSDETKEFLKENLSDIGRITQKYLMYPSISIRTKQQGMNVVEFFLHPNGDITNLKLIKSSTYTALDSNSIHTIKVAYKDYPKPKEVTKIRIFVYYKLY